MSRFAPHWVAALSTLLLAGCGVTKGVREDIAIREPVAKAFIEKAPVRAQSANVIEVSGARLRVTEVAYNKNKGLWLKKMSFSYRAATPVPLSQIIAAISAKGVNIVNDMPIDNITFMGSIPNTDVDTALRQLLGSVGLDFAVNDSSKLVTITPLPSRTWKLPISERTSNFSSSGQSGASGLQGGSSGANGSSSSGQTGQNGASGSTGSASVASSSTGGAQSSQTSSGGSDSSLGSDAQNGGFSAGNNFWSKMEKYLNDRLQVMVPVPRSAAQVSGAPNMPTPMGAGPIPSNFGAPNMGNPMAGGTETMNSGGELYMKKKAGHFAYNSNTRTVTVYAPHWILNDLDPYFHGLVDELNTQISIKGVMLLVSKSKSNSEGVDLQNFATWAAGRYGAVVSNNTLGGVTVNFDSGKIPNVSTGNTTLGGPLLGIVSAPDGLKLFNNYMEQFGNTYVVQEPRIATTPGVSGEFKNIVTDFYVKLGQSASAGNTGSAVAVNSNERELIKLGTELSVFPDYDPATGIVRALIVSRSIVKDGSKNLPQFLTSGNTQQQLNQSVPITRELSYKGEALLRDGDLIVFGGQTEETMSTDESGLPGPNGPLGGALGTKSATRGGGTYYFALKVSVSKL